MRREVRDCEGCKTSKDIGPDGEIYIDLPRRSGEMDGGATSIDLCHKCCAALIKQLHYAVQRARHIPIEEEFVTMVRNGTWRSLGK